MDILDLSSAHACHILSAISLYYWLSSPPKTLSKRFKIAHNLSKTENVKYRVKLYWWLNMIPKRLSIPRSISLLPCKMFCFYFLHFIQRLSQQELLLWISLKNVSKYDDLIQYTLMFMKKKKKCWENVLNIVCNSVPHSMAISWITFTNFSKNVSKSSDQGYS